MLRKLAIAICALGLAAGGLMLSTPAQAQGIKVGVLTCNVASGFGFIFGSSRAINCTFSRLPFDNARIFLRVSNSKRSTSASR